MVQPLHIRVGMRAYAQGTKKPVHIEQLWPQNFGQFAARQPARHFHLEQPVLRLHITQCAVHVGLGTGAYVGHAALVITHFNRRLETGQHHLPAALGLFAVDVPGSQSGRNKQHQAERYSRYFDDPLHFRFAFALGLRVACRSSYPARPVVLLPRRLVAWCRAV